MKENKNFLKVFCKYYSCGRRIGIQFDEKENLLIDDKYRQTKKINPQESNEYKKDFEKYINDKKFIAIIDSNSLTDSDLKYLKEEGFIQDTDQNTDYEKLLKNMAEAKEMTGKGIIK